jgi:hypothetical protein
MDELTYFLVHVGAEKYQDRLISGGLDSVVKLTSASDSHLKYIGLPIGTRKKISLATNQEEVELSPQQHGASNPGTTGRQAPTAGGARRTDTRPLWSAAASGTGCDTAPAWERLIGLRGDKENQALLNLSMHQVQRLHQEQVSRLTNGSEVKEERSDFDFVIVAADNEGSNPALQSRHHVVRSKDQGNVSDANLVRLRALRAELRATEEQVMSLKKMVDEVEREIRVSASGQQMRGLGTREVIEID